MFLAAATTASGGSGRCEDHWNWDWTDVETSSFSGSDESCAPPTSFRFREMERHKRRRWQTMRGDGSIECSRIASIPAGARSIRHQALARAYSMEDVCGDREVIDGAASPAEDHHQAFHRWSGDRAAGSQLSRSDNGGADVGTLAAHRYNSSGEMMHSGSSGGTGSDRWPMRHNLHNPYDRKSSADYDYAYSSIVSPADVIMSDIQHFQDDKRALRNTNRKENIYEELKLPCNSDSWNDDEPPPLPRRPVGLERSPMRTIGMSCRSLNLAHSHSSSSSSVLSCTPSSHRFIDVSIGHLPWYDSGFSQEIMRHGHCVPSRPSVPFSRKSEGCRLKRCESLDVRIAPASSRAPRQWHGGGGGRLARLPGIRQLAGGYNARDEDEW